MNGAALACFVQSGLKAICGTLRFSAQLGGDQFGALGRSAVQQHHVGVLGVDLVEPVPDQLVIVEVEPAGEGDLGSRGQQHLVFGPAFGGEEVAAVDHGRGQRAVVDLRA